MLDPHDVRTREFLISLRGYDQNEVRDFLDDVAAHLEEAQRAAYGSGSTSFSELARATERIVEQAEQVAQDIVALAEQRAKRIETESRHRAERLAEQLLHASREEAQRVLRHPDDELLP